MTPPKRHKNEKHEQVETCCGHHSNDCCDDKCSTNEESCCGGHGEDCCDHGLSASAQMREFEVLQRAIGRLLGQQQFDSADDANAFVSNLIADKSPEQIFAQLALTPEEESLLMVARAMKACDDDEALQLLERALELDPMNLDARVALISADSPEEEAERLRDIVRDAERQLGEEFFTAHRGNFYTDPVTRPYMRARQMLMTALGQTGDVVGAIDEANALLELCPNDNLGVREFLVGYYLRSDRAEDALALMDQRYPNDHGAVFEYGRVLGNHRLGHEDAALEALRNAFDRNPYVLPLLFGLMRPEEVEQSTEPGSPGEAMFVIGVLYDAFVANQPALEWAVGKWQELMG